MSTDVVLPTTIDATAREAVPNTNYANRTTLQMNVGGSTDAAQAFIYFKQPMPAGAVVSSAILTLTLANAWSSKTLKTRRITTKWAESKIRWALRPSTDSGSELSQSVTGAAGTAITVDVSSIMQDVADGNPFFGFRLGISQHALQTIYSSEAADPDVRPTLEVVWSVIPDPPDTLAPDADNAVSVQFPKLRWNDGETEQGWMQVQLNQTTDDFSSPDYDTGQIAADASQFDTNDGTFTGISNGQTWYWRVKIWDTAGNESDWSASAQFKRTNLSSLSIDSPGSTSDTTQPEVAWTFGGTQVKYRVTLSSVAASGKLTTLWGPELATDGATTALQPDANLIKTGVTYRFTVEIWDAIPRDADDHAIDTQDFTYVESGVPDPVDTISVSTFIDSQRGTPTPAVQIDFTRAAAGDYWCLRYRKTGTSTWHEVDDRIDISDTHVSGDSYSIIYWGNSPRVSYDYQVQAMELHSGVYKASTGDPHGTAAAQAVAIWLVDDSDGLTKDAGDYVAIFGAEDAQVGIGESGTTYDLPGSRAPVRVLDIVRGYEGTISGTILGNVDRDMLFDLKGRDRTLRLIFGDVSIPIHLEEAASIPTPAPGDVQYATAFSFFQVGAPWPVT